LVDYQLRRYVVSQPTLKLNQNLTWVD